MLGFSIRIAMAVGVVLGTGPALGDDGEGYGPQHGLEELRFAAPLTPQARDRLNAGQALPVIVTFALPEGLEQSRAPGDAAFLERQRLIRETQDDVLRATFGSSLDQLTARAAFAQLEEAAEIHVDPSFSIVPGFSAFLNASAIADIQRHPLVDAVYEDVPGRPLLDESTALIGAQALWAQGLVGAGGAVAVLDTGVEKEHPMVGPAITASACFSSNASGISTSLCPDGSEEMINLTGADAGDACVDTRVDPENGSSGCYHGTHVASIAAGRFATLSSGVISGVARGADIVAINVFSRFPPEDCDEEGEDGSHCVRTFSSDQLKALEWIYTNREQLSVSSVNMSLGGGRHTSPCETHVLRPIIQNLLAADIATVIASGNDGYGDAVSSPACVPEAITVGATDAQDSVPSFSNSAESLDLLAPGVSITGAFLTEEPAPGENCAINDADPGADGVCHWFAGLSGTSMAAPHVAGAFTLLRAAVPGASVSDILRRRSSFTGAQIVDVNGITRSRIQVDAAHAVLEQGGVFAENVQLTPLSPFRTSGQAGVAASFASLEYTLTNQSFAGQTVTVVEKPAWIDTGSR
jgi:subtilisin family serine protease